MERKRNKKGYVKNEGVTKYHQLRNQLKDQGLYEKGMNLHEMQELVTAINFSKDDNEDTILESALIESQFEMIEKESKTSVLNDSDVSLMLSIEALRESDLNKSLYTELSPVVLTSQKSSNEPNPMPKNFEKMMNNHFSILGKVEGASNVPVQQNFLRDYFTTAQVNDEVEEKWLPVEVEKEYREVVTKKYDSSSDSDSEICCLKTVTVVVDVHHALDWEPKSARKHREDNEEPGALRAAGSTFFQKVDANLDLIELYKKKN